MTNGTKLCQVIKNISSLDSPRTDFCGLRKNRFRKTEKESVLCVLVRMENADSWKHLALSREMSSWVGESGLGINGGFVHGCRFVFKLNDLLTRLMSTRTNQKRG